MIMAGPKKETTQMHPARSSIGNQGWIQSWREGPDNQLYHQNFQLSNLSCPRVPARILKSKSCENPKKTVTQDTVISSHRGKTSPTECAMDDGCPLLSIPSSVWSRNFQNVLWETAPCSPSFLYQISSLLAMYLAASGS